MATPPIALRTGLVCFILRVATFRMTSGLTHVATTLRLIASQLLAAMEDDLKAEHPDLVDAIDKLVAEDPSGGRRKYLKWQVGQLKKKEPLNEVISLVKTFHQKQARLEVKDLYAYKTLGDLRGAIEALAPKQSRSEKKGTHEYLLNTDDLLVVHPQDMEASCFFGKGAKWCISAEMSENYFDTYSFDNDYFYFVIDKKAPPKSTWSKIAVQMRKGSTEPTFWNADDTSVTSEKLKFRLPIDQWFPIVTKRHSSQGDTYQYRVAQGAMTVEEIPKNASVDVTRKLAEVTSKLTDLEALARSEDVVTRQWVAKNNNISVKLLEKLARDDHDSVRISVLTNPGILPATLSYLANDHATAVRAAVARHDLTPAEALTALAGDPTARVREFVGENVNTPVEVLERLATSTDAGPRRGVASNPRTPKETLIVLARDRSFEVRRNVAGNLNSPREALELLKYDPERTTSAIANNRLRGMPN